jgi:DNA-binding GntR family transcriptional regulator
VNNLGVKGPVPVIEFSSKVKRIKVQSAPQAAAEAIREAITEGLLKPGQRLIEQKLAASLGIGQPTLREALNELEHQGFVYKIPQKGTYITTFNKRDCRELLEVRMSLELVAVEKAALKMTAKIEEELAALVDGMRAAARAFDIAHFRRCDAEFHHKIAEVAENSHLTRILAGIISQMLVYGTLGRKGNSRKGLIDGAEEHGRISTALASRDTVAARRVYISETIKHWNENYGLDLKPGDLPSTVLFTESEE